MTEIGNGYKVEKIYRFEIDGESLRIRRVHKDTILVIYDSREPTNPPLHLERFYMHGCGSNWNIDMYYPDFIDDIEHFITDGASKIESYINEHGAPPIEE